MTEWKPIETAPYDVEVELRLTRRRRPLRAVLRRDASMTEDEVPCDQWQAVNDDYPKCWSEGSCWASNANCCTSDQPTAWRYP